MEQLEDYYEQQQQPKPAPPPTPAGGQLPPPSGIPPTTMPVVPIDDSDPPPPFFNISQTEISSIRSVLVDAMNQPFCAAFMSDFLTELGNVTAVAPYSLDPVEIFDRLQQTNSIQGTGESAVLGRAGGSAGGGNATVGINLTNMQGRLGPAGVAHEVTHTATASGREGYSHEDMNRAAYRVLREWRVVGPQGALGSAFSSRINGFNYAGKAMDIFCGRPRPRGR